MSGFRPEDEDARARARSDHRTSLVLEAGAGTGKTTLLVERIEALVRSGAARLEEIAAVTFTENAATTMKLRLREKLEQARASGALAAITAAVVGVILNLTVWFVLHVLFADVQEARAGPLRWYGFDPLTIDLKVSALALVAAVLAFVLHRGLVQLVLTMAALGIAVRLLL